MSEGFVHFKKGLVAFDFDRSQIEVCIGYISRGRKSFGKSLTVKYDKVLNWEYRDREKISTEDRMEFAVELFERMKKEMF